MKKMIMLVVLLVLCGQGMSTTIYSDSFEGYTVGQAAPSPWNTWYSSGTFVTNTAAKTGTQSVNLNGSAAGSIGTDTAFYSAGTVEFSFGEFGGAGSTDMQVYITNAATEIIAELNINYWGGIAYKRNGGYTNIKAGALSGILSTFNTLKIDYDTTAKTVNVFFNDVQIGTDLAMNSNVTGTGDGTRVYLQAWGASAGSPILVDDWSFTAVPEPATISLLAIGAAGLLKRRK